ncbi:MAG: sigma-54 dependent transcriptional regulator [Methylococcales bacterium]|nr:sigma-54 dependent transcriptional regulator [Methylococcales bacterium]
MDSFSAIIGKSPELESLIRSARVIAATDVTVLIKGETGTGKEILATAIQQQSPRAGKPFITLNCAALPESLVESEIFGHKKGAFTGALTDKQGIFQAVDGGTLFLDEINSLPLSIQSKLLRFLESGECMPVGGANPYTVNVRIIAATNADLTTMMEDGEFRRDLFFRLNVVPLDLPALHQRREDIKLLTDHFFDRFAASHGLKMPKLSKLARKAMNDYRWPGNIRELRNLCERLCILLPGCFIEPENLPREFHQLPAEQEPSADFVLPELGIQLDALEADIIYQALVRTRGNRSKTARLLGISRDTLLYRIQKHGLSTH